MEIKEAKEILKAGLAWANWTEEQTKAVTVAYLSMLQMEETTIKISESEVSEISKKCAAEFKETLEFAD